MRTDVSRVASGNRRICLSTGVLSLDAIVHAPCRISTQAYGQPRPSRPPFQLLLCAEVAVLPAPGRDVRVTVAFHVDRQGGEFWRWRFAGGATMRVRCGSRRTRRIAGREVFHRLTPSPQGLRRNLVGRWPPLPRWLISPTLCSESGNGDRFVFDIDVKFPLIGQLIHYRGWLLQQGQGR